jgi:hypothetical protein
LSGYFLRLSCCSFGLSATSQQYFPLRTNQPPAISHQPNEQADFFLKKDNDQQAVQPGFA